MMDSTLGQGALAVYRQLLQAWNGQNAEAFAALFTADGSSVGFDGSPMNGRADIASTLKGIFGGHTTATYVAKIREIRPLAENVTLIRAVAGMVPRGQQAINPAVNTIQSIVVTQESGQPRIALLHNTPAAFHGRPEASEQLTRELTEVLNSEGTVAVPEPRT